MFELNNDDEVLLPWLIPRVGISPEIPFRQGIEKVQTEIFLDANHLPADLKRAVWVVRVHQGKCKARITLEIAKLLARFGLTETDVFSIPVEPDWAVVWLAFRPDGADMGQAGCVQQIIAFLKNICPPPFFPSLLLTIFR